MPKFQIEFPEEFPIVRAGATVVVKVSRLPDNVRSSLFAFALGNKIGDAASGALGAVGLEKGQEPNAKQSAEMAAWAAEKMNAVLATLEAGVWSQRGTGGSTDPHAAIRGFIRIVLKSMLAAKGKGGKAKVADLDAIFDKQSADTQAAIIAKAKKLAAAAVEADDFNLDI